MVKKIRIKPIIFVLYVVVASVFSAKLMTFNFFFTLALLGDVFIENNRIHKSFELLTRFILLGVCYFCFFYFSKEAGDNRALIAYLTSHIIYGYAGTIFSLFFKIGGKKRQKQFKIQII